MNKELNDKEEKTELLVSTFDGQESMGVKVLSRGSIRTAARQTRFYDKVLALAELPKPNELPKILQVSHQSGIPSIWNRARPSPLENSAAALLTALTFCSRKERLPLIRQFFKIHGLKVGLRGRPRLHPTQIKATLRGIQIDGLKARLQAGVAIKAEIKRTEEYESGDEFLTAKLQEAGYDQVEIDAIRDGKTLQDAALRLYFARFGKRENVTLKGIQNSYAAYKQRTSDTSHQDVPRSRK
jgi:hypothetical protein